MALRRYQAMAMRRHQGMAKGRHQPHHQRPHQPPRCQSLPQPSHQLAHPLRPLPRLPQVQLILNLIRNHLLLLPAPTLGLDRFLGRVEVPKGVAAKGVAAKGAVAKATVPKAAAAGRNRMWIQNRMSLKNRM
jgi:hypothetical protein